MGTRVLQRLAIAALVALAACGSGGGGGGGGGDVPDALMPIDQGSVADQSLPTDQAAPTDQSAPADSAMPTDLAGGRPDGSVLITTPPKLLWSQGNGIPKVSGGGRSLHLLIGQPLAIPFGLSPSYKLEPGLFPQTKVH